MQFSAKYIFSNCFGHQKTAVKSVLRKHIESAHDRIKPHMCSICGTSFSRKDVLDNHIQKMHNENKEQYKCSYCDAIFLHKKKLKAIKKPSFQMPRMWTSVSKQTRSIVMENQSKNQNVISKRYTNFS